MKPLIFLSFVAIIFFSSCKPAADDHGNDNNNPSMNGMMDTACARRLVKNFGERSIRGCGGLRKVDTRFVWFDIKKLKSLVNRIDSQGGSGIRFYMAAYDRDSIPKKMKYDSAFMDYSTLIMVSTYDTLIRDTIRHYDYYDNKRPGMPGVIIGTQPENQGEMCPPPAICDNKAASLLEQKKD